MDAITVKKLIEVKIEDKNKVPIRVGSVLKCVEDGTRGVVQEIAIDGKVFDTPTCEGDLKIKLKPGHHRITNRYDKWEHIPHENQTYLEKYTSWLFKPFEPIGCGDMSEDTELAIQGIVALLPEDTIDENGEPWIDRIEGALELLAEHLDEIKKSDEW